MRMIHTDAKLHELEGRCLYHAGRFGMTLPEVRFYILDGMEFASLLEKKVYPVSPVNIWEGKRMVTKKHRIETGQESSLYYEVVQTGNPSYAYLNNTNSATTQASVMAHVFGHCEFSERNVLQDSTADRTEYVMWQVKKVNLSRQQMGERHFFNYWNAAESALPLLAPNGRFNLEHSLETDRALTPKRKRVLEEKAPPKAMFTPFSETLDSLLRAAPEQSPIELELSTRIRQENLNRRGFRLRAPCQDVFGFLRGFAPTTRAEFAVMDYLYVTQAPTDFVIRTQIMNEGWAMYWEKKIMLELFKERAVRDIIDYAKIFSGVCYPRPYYQRNPYHLGFHLWCHIEELFRKGKVSLEYQEETDREVRENWDRCDGGDAVEKMRNLVATVTDYEFLRRFLSPSLIDKFHLNRIPQRDFIRLGISKREVIREDKYWVWLDPVPIKEEMLNFFTHFYRPRIYVIDADFEDGGLLLFHRNDGRRLRANWIQPTLKNINHIWKNGVFLISGTTLYGYSGGRHRERRIREMAFETVCDYIQSDKKPLVLE